MNAAIPFPGGGGAMTRPLWLPPVDVRWIYTALIVFGAAQADRLQPELRARLTHPVGLFAILLAALGLYNAGYKPAAFATVFFALMIWSTDMTRKTEGFMDAAPTLDWVTNSRRWFVERVMKERPVAIQERDVATYPIAGASAQAGTQAGTT